MSTLEIRGYPSGPLQAVCYVVFHTITKAAMIVDPGDHNSSVVDFINRAELRPKYILATHGHMDHIFGAGYFKGKYPEAKVLCHKKDTNIWKYSDKFASAFGVTPPKDWMKEGPEETFEEETDHLVSLSSDPSDDIGVVFSPGHTPGSVLYYNRKNKMILTGDTIFSGGIGRTDFPGGSYEEMKNSLERTKDFFRADPNWKDFTIYPGHGGSSNAEWAYKSASNFF